MHLNTVAKNKAWKQANPDKVKLYARQQYTRNLAFIRAAKSVPCSDCKVQYNPWQMHFDHRNPADKSFGIALGMNRKKAILLAEMAKCDVVCANCHADRTHKRYPAK